ncbi:hypothetical protein, partial [Pseudomonas sp. N8]|uniref:hypothetical protein n=1 Tax=Pseudomonas sp. N8 TaxID=3449428 RepID=UPI003F69E888
DNCPIMLRASLLANAAILPQARKGSYFFNRIDQKLTVATGRNWPIAAAYAVVSQKKWMYSSPYSANSETMNSVFIEYINNAPTKSVDSCSGCLSGAIKSIV